MKRHMLLASALLIVLAAPAFAQQSGGGGGGGGGGGFANANFSNVTLTGDCTNVGLALSCTGGGAITSLSGDVTASGPGAAPATVTGLQGNAVDSTAPTDNYRLTWVAADSKIEWKAGGSGTMTALTLAPGFAKTVGTQNIGSDQITTTGTINGQLWPKTVASSCTINVNCDSTNPNGGEILIPTGAAVTLTAPNPSSGTKGVSYTFGSDGTHGYTVTTAGGTATLYGCTGAGSGVTSLTLDTNLDMVITDDGANYKCTVAGSKTVYYPLTMGPGLSAGSLPITNFFGIRTITAIRCNPEVLVGGAATIDVYKAPSGTALSAGTKLSDTASCNGNTGLYTDQNLTTATAANWTLAAGDRIGVVYSGAGFGSTNPGVVVVTVAVR